MSTTTWIIIIVIVFLIIAIIVGIVLYFFVFRNKTTPSTTQPPPNRPVTPVNPNRPGGGGSGGGSNANRLRYGDIISLFNIDNTAGGFLYPCGNQGAGCNFNAAVRSTDFKNWRIVASNGQTTGTELQYGDLFRLQATTNNSFLGYCGNTNSACGTNVGTRPEVNNSTTWSFGRSGSPADNFVNSGINLEVINNVDQNKLNVCGRSGSCNNNINVTNRNNNATRSSIFTWIATR